MPVSNRKKPKCPICHEDGVRLCPDCKNIAYCPKSSPSGLHSHHFLSYDDDEDDEDHLELDREDHDRECTRMYAKDPSHAASAAKKQQQKSMKWVAHLGETQRVTCVPNQIFIPDAIKERAIFSEHTDHEAVHRLFELIEWPDAIYIDEKQFSGLNVVLGRKLVDYARAGGRVVHGGNLAGLISFDELDGLLQHVWNVAWRAVAYTSAELRLNRQHPLLLAYRKAPRPGAASKPDAQLLDEVYQKGVFVGDVPPEHAIYRERSDISEDDLEDMSDEAKAQLPDGVQLERSPVAMTRVGKGWVGWIGMNSPEAHVRQITLAMLGVL